MSIYIGIDWSQDKHDVAFMNAAGAIIARLTIPHQPDGFRKLETTRQQLAVTAADCLVGLENSPQPAARLPLGPRLPAHLRHSTMGGQEQSGALRSQWSTRRYARCPASGRLAAHRPRPSAALATGQSADPVRFGLASDSSVF